MNSPTKVMIEEALFFAETCHKDKSLFPGETISIKALAVAYIEAIKVLHEVREEHLDALLELPQGEELTDRIGEILEKAPEYHKT